MYVEKLNVLVFDVTESKPSANSGYEGFSSICRTGNSLKALYPNDRAYYFSGWRALVVVLDLFLSYYLHFLIYDFCFFGDGDGVCFGRFAASRHENIICMCIGLKYLKRTQIEPIITRPVKVDY